MGCLWERYVSYCISFSDPTKMAVTHCTIHPPGDTSSYLWFEEKFAVGYGPAGEQQITSSGTVTVVSSRAWLVGSYNDGVLTELLCDRPVAGCQARCSSVRVARHCIGGRD